MLCTGSMATSQSPSAALQYRRCTRCHRERTTLPCGQLKRDQQKKLYLKWQQFQCAACCNVMSVLEALHEWDDPWPRWKVFHPCCMDIDWTFSMEAMRPIARILVLAHFYYVESTWLVDRCSSNFELPRGLSLSVETYFLHRSLSVAQIYGSSKGHGFLITRNIVQSTTVQVVTVFFCGYSLWTSHSRSQCERLANLKPMPSRFYSWKDKDSDIVVTRGVRTGLLMHMDIWAALQARERLCLPLPRWISQIYKTHYWWWH